MSGVPVIKAASVPAILLIVGAAMAAPVEDLPDPPVPGTGMAPPPVEAPPLPGQTVPKTPAPPPTSSHPALPKSPVAPPAAPAAPPAAPAVSPAVPAAQANPDDKLPPLPRPQSPAAIASDSLLPLPGRPTSKAEASPEMGGDEVGTGRRLGIGGYGEAQVLSGFSGHDTNVAFRRLGLFLGHRFNDWIRAYAEAEVENTDTVGIAQAYVDFDVDTWLGLRAGLMLVPVGIVNQLHEPPTYLTVDRPLTDQLIIPSTWRELGFGIFGDLGSWLRYQAAALGGLDPDGFSAKAPLWGTRGNGQDMEIHDPAFAGRLDFTGVLGLDIGAAGYVGWARGGHVELKGVRVGVGEVDVRYQHEGFDARFEYAHLFIIDSYRLNDYYGVDGAASIPARGRGFYLQAGYDLFKHLLPELAPQELLVFAGYENVNPRSRMSPYNANPSAITGPNESPPNAPSSANQYIRAGLTYRPHPQVAVKLDVQLSVGSAGLPPTMVPPLQGLGGTLRPLDPAVVALASEASRLGLGLSFMF